MWIDHLSRTTMESLHDLFDPLTLVFRHPVSKNKWLVQYWQKIYKMKEYVNKNNTCT
jgi:hypothetical protein